MTTIFALDYLGGAMYQSVVLAAHPEGWGAGFFADTFGSVWRLVDKLCATGKCPLIRIQGPWTNHAYNPKSHDKAIFAALSKTKDLALKFPGITFQFSPVCESDARGAAWRQLFTKLKELAGPVKLICSVGTKGESIPGVVTEIHGSTRKPSGRYQYSYDGTSSVDANVEKDKATHSKAEVFFFWHQSFNLKYKTKLTGGETPEVKKNDSSAPKERWCKPTVPLVESVAALRLPKGKPKLKARNLWKTHSDRHETPPEARAYKPVHITPAKVAALTLVDSDGNQVAKSTVRMSYNDGRWRYYFGSFGYQIGNRVLTLMADKVSLGTVNPAFREGEYRS